MTHTSRSGSRAAGVNKSGSLKPGPCSRGRSGKRAECLCHPERLGLALDQQREAVGGKLSTKTCLSLFFFSRFTYQLLDSCFGGAVDPV